MEDQPNISREGGNNRETAVRKTHEMLRPQLIVAFPLVNAFIA
jgi:hypothetical protein